MFGKLFGKGKKDTPIVIKPSIMGLEVGTSFDVDTLGFQLIMDKLTIAEIAKTHIIKAAGKVELDGNTIFRFYSDDEAFLQVVCEGEAREENIIDVKLFHYFDTLSVSSEAEWNTLLNSKIGTPTYTLNNQTFEREWDSVGDYAMPVHMREVTFDDSDEPDETDQFTMLFTRNIDDDTFEALLLSAEESENENGNLDRCFVMSTGVSLSPAQVSIN